MIRQLPVLALCALYGALCDAAPTPTLYKCTLDGKVAYGDQPCAHGAGQALAVPSAPPFDPGYQQDLQRQKALLARLQKQRTAREEREQQRQARASQAAAQHNKHCARLRLNKKWADENVNQAAGFDKEPLRQKARRQAEAMALECPG